MNSAVVSQSAPQSILIIGESQPSLTSRLNELYQITQVSLGKDALQRLITSHFDAIVMNLQIPDMDGLSLFHKIRSNHDEQSLPIILFSSRDHKDKVINALRAGANDYIASPIDNELAIARISAQLRGRHELSKKDAQIAELQAQQETQARLIRIIRHDLKNPVSNLRLATELLAQEIPDKILLESMIVSLNSTEEILEDFANAYMIQQADVIHRERISLDLLLSEIAVQFSAVVLHKEIQLNIPVSGLIICEDRLMAKQALSNLFSNAFKYSPQQTSVTVQIDPSEERIRIMVKDQGPGIPIQERDLLFTEFGRASTRPTGNETSTGLGLWIVRTIIEKIGGAYGVEFPSEGGSAFWIELNVCPAEVGE